MIPLTWGRISETKYAAVRPGNSVVRLSSWGCTVITATSCTPGDEDCCRRSHPKSSTSAAMRNKKIAGPGDVVRITHLGINFLLYFPSFKWLASLLEKARLAVATLSQCLFSIQELPKCLFDLGHAIQQLAFKGYSFVLGHSPFFLKLLFVASDLVNECPLFLIKPSP